MKLGIVTGMCLMLLVIAAVVMTGCTTKGLNYEAGLGKFEDKQYDEALPIFQEIAESGGSYGNRARYYMGECYKLKFDWEKATQQFQMVVDTESPTSYLAAQARNRIAQIREGRNDITRVNAVYYNLKDIDPERAADSLLELGSIYENKLNDYDNAIKTYRQVVTEFPGTGKAAQAQVNIGNIYFNKLYDYVGGWPEYRKVNEKDYPDMKYRVGEVESMLRNTNKVRQEISEHQAFIKESQKRRIPKGRKITSYDIYGVRAEQVAHSFVAVGKKWRELKNYPRALEAYRLCVERLPLKLVQAAESRFSIAEIYQEEGRYFEAIDAYEEYIKFHPTDYRRDQAIYNMAICYEALRDYERAYERYVTYRDTYRDGKFYQAAELKVRQYEYDEDQDGYPYYKELVAGTRDTDANQHP